MDWTAPLDGYCERLSPAFWAEPVNALTNAAFLVAALAMAWRLRGARRATGWVLVGLLATIGVGSFLFHTFATGWAALADTLPIALFVLAYTFVAARDFLGLSPGRAALVTAGFLPFAALATPVLGLVPVLGASSVYVAVLVWLAGFAALAGGATGRGMWGAVALFAVSLTARSLDMTLCPAWPLGTHFLWHVLNGALLGWLIEVWRRDQRPDLQTRHAPAKPATTPNGGRHVD